MEVKYPLILDGATGTQLQKRGFDSSVCAEDWVLQHPEAIAEIQAQIEEIKAPKEEPAPTAPAVPTCPACGNQVSEEAKFCPDCGAKLEVSAPAEVPAEEAPNQEPAQIQCPECEAANPAGTNFCSGCGTKLN